MAYAEDLKSAQAILQLRAPKCSTAKVACIWVASEDSIRAASRTMAKQIDQPTPEPTPVFPLEVISHCSSASFRRRFGPQCLSVVPNRKSSHLAVRNLGASRVEHTANTALGSIPFALKDFPVKRKVIFDHHLIIKVIATTLYSALSDVTYNCWRS